MKNEATALADARIDYQKLSDTHAEKWAEWTKENEDLLARMGEAKDALREAEEALRATALAHYEAHPDSKKLPYGVGVRITQSLVYDADTAFVWAQEHKMALALDKRAFEKIAKANPPDFVTVKEVPTVTIPSDTAKLLAE